MHIYAPPRRLISDREVKSAAGAREEEDLAALRVRARARGERESNRRCDVRTLETRADYVIIIRVNKILVIRLVLSNKLFTISLIYFFN